MGPRFLELQSYGDREREIVLYKNPWFNLTKKIIKYYSCLLVEKQQAAQDRN